MVLVKEPFEEIKLKNGVEITRTTYNGIVYYCDDCNSVIEGDERFNPCHLCGKDLCKDHRNNYPSNLIPIERRAICDRCKKQFAKELQTYSDYLLAKHFMDKAISQFEKTYGYVKYGNSKFSNDHNLYLLDSSKDIRREQEKCPTTSWKKLCAKNFLLRRGEL